MTNAIIRNSRELMIFIASKHYKKIKNSYSLLYMPKNTNTFSMFCGIFVFCAEETVKLLKLNFCSVWRVWSPALSEKYQKDKLLKSVARNMLGLTDASSFISFSSQFNF